MLNNNIYKEELETKDIIAPYSPDSRIIINIFSEMIKSDNEKEKKHFYATITSLYEEYTLKDLNSLIFAIIANNYGTCDKDKFKEYISFINNANQGKSEFNNLVNQDCYDKLTEILGMIPDEAISSNLS